MKFAGFPARAKATAIPNVYFSDVLPRLGDEPAAVGVALYAFHPLMAKRGFPRHVSGEELVADPSLATFLRRAGALCSDDPSDHSLVVENALRRCVDAGMLLELHRADSADDCKIYFLNAPSDRRAMEAA